MLLSPAAGRADIFTTTKTFDFVDSNLGDGVCLNVAEQGCSLRAAVQEANALGGFHTIRLKSGTHRLTLRDAGAADEDAAATGDLDVTADILIESTSASVRGIQMAFDEFEGPPEDRIFHVLPAGDLTLRSVSLEDGVANSASTSRGGAILNEGILDIADCTLDGNEARDGGAIYNEGSLTADACTFSNNTALDSGGAIFGGSGAVVDLENSTLSGNEGLDVLHLENVRESTLSHVTIQDNTGKGIMADLTQTLFVTILSSIVAGSSGANCAFSGSVRPGSLTSLSSDTSCGFAATDGFDSTDPELGLLEDNGGVTETHLPADTSAAVDNAFEDSCPEEDQRGTLRPDGHGMLGVGQCDIGAVELLPEPGAVWLGLAALLAVRVLARRRA
jgi:predicted outer membrane repeat protein